MKKLLTIIIIASAVVSGCCNGHNHRSVMQGTSVQLTDTPPLLAMCCYTLFAFVTLSFNPFNWQEITRAFYVVLLVIIDFSILTAPKDLFE